MKHTKLLASAFALYLLGTNAACAQLDVQLNLGQPGYVVAQPAYVSPYPTYYDPHHRGHDFKYWQEHRQPAHEVPRGHEAPRGHEEHGGEHR